MLKLSIAIILYLHKYEISCSPKTAFPLGRCQQFKVINRFYRSGGEIIPSLLCTETGGVRTTIHCRTPTEQEHFCNRNTGASLCFHTCDCWFQKEFPYFTSSEVHGVHGVNLNAYGTLILWHSITQVNIGFRFSCTASFCAFLPVWVYRLCAL